MVYWWIYLLVFQTWLAGKSSSMEVLGWEKQLNINGWFPIAMFDYIFCWPGFVFGHWRHPRRKLMDPKLQETPMFGGNENIVSCRCSLKLNTTNDWTPPCLHCDLWQLGFMKMFPSTMTVSIGTTHVWSVPNIYGYVWSMQWNFE